MHPALRLPHVLEQIAAESFDRYRVQGGDKLKSLALVNHAFSDAALSQIWDHTSEHSLAKRMPNIREQDVLGEDGKAYTGLTIDALEPSDLHQLATSRFTFYSRRVRKLNYRMGINVDLVVDHRIISAWAANLDIFLPNLSVLDLSGHGVCSTSRLEAAFSLLSPRIKKLVLHLGTRSADALADISTKMMSRFYASCSELVQLRVAVRRRIGGTPTAIKTILSGFIVASFNLQSADFARTDGLEYEAFLHLAALPDLRYLDVSQFHLDPTAPALPAGSFSRLDEFRAQVRNQDTHVVRAFLALPPTGHLRKFSLEIYPNSTIPINTFTHVVQALRSFRTLAFVKICPDLSPEEVLLVDRANASWDILEPLSRLPVLQRLDILGTLPFVISEERLLLLAAAWPRLKHWEICVFRPPPGTPVYMYISLVVLLEMLRRCVAVEHLPYFEVTKAPLPDKEELSAFAQQNHVFRGMVRTAEDDEAGPLVQTLRRVLRRAEVIGDWV